MILFGSIVIVLTMWLAYAIKWGWVNVDEPVTPTFGQVDTVYTVMEMVQDTVNTQVMSEADILREYREYRMKQCNCYLSPVIDSATERGTYPDWAGTFGEWLKGK